MITAKDLHKHMKQRESVVQLNKEVDTWLTDVVFPSYSKEKTTYTIEGYLRDHLSCFVYTLAERGFDTEYKVEKGLYGEWCKLTLILPPQDI